MITFTEAQLERTKQNWEAIAKEKIDFSTMGSSIYALGSELAVLRIAQEYRHSGDKARAAYSTNMNSWYFRLETV